MSEERIEVGARLNEVVALQLAADLNLVQQDRDVVLDFSHTQHFEPFGMLLVSSAVNRLRLRLDAVNRTLEVPTAGLDPEGIASHMGFWKSMSVDVGQALPARGRHEKAAD